MLWQLLSLFCACSRPLMGISEDSTAIFTAQSRPGYLIGPLAPTQSWSKLINLCQNSPLLCPAEMRCTTLREQQPLPHLKLCLQLRGLMGGMSKEKSFSVCCHMVSCARTTVLLLLVCSEPGGLRTAGSWGQEGDSPMEG